MTPMACQKAFRVVIFFTSSTYAFITSVDMQNTIFNLQDINRSNYRGSLKFEDIHKTITTMNIRVIR